MLWICRAFDSHQNSQGNNGAFLPDFTGLECIVLMGYLLGLISVQYFLHRLYNNWSIS